MYVRVLGSAAGGGFPQWNCGCANCAGVRSGSIAARPRTQESVAVSADGRISGCYIHGLLTDDRQRRHWLRRLGATVSSLDYQAEVEATLDQLADHLEKHLDCGRLLALARPPRFTPAG